MNTLKKLLPVALLLQCLAGALYAADQVQIRADAPSRYEVVRGDTLWDISGRFLEDPWLWPEVWELNPQINNPHLIYPGDVIELQYTANGPMLRLNRGGVPAAEGLRPLKLSPQLRRESLSSGAIDAIPLDQISSVLSGNIVVPVHELDSAPYLLGNRSGSLFTSDTDDIFAKGSWSADVNQYDIIRPGREYTDPETGTVIGVEGKLIGSATILENDATNATLRVTDIKEEARKGDRFIPSAGNRIDSNYFPRPPAFHVNARIVDIAKGRRVGGKYDTIVINKGSSDRLRSGDLLALQKQDVLMADDLGEATVGERFKRSLGFSDSDQVTFSGEIFASVLIYRVFDNTSLGIILSADDAVRLDDLVVTP